MYDERESEVCFLRVIFKVQVEASKRFTVAWEAKATILPSGERAIDSMEQSGLIVCLDAPVVTSQG